MKSLYVVFSALLLGFVPAFFNTNSAIAGCGWGDITCDPKEWKCPVGGCPPGTIIKPSEPVQPSNLCPHGGRSAGVNCKIYAFQNPVIVVPGVKYWVSVEYAGVYYKPVDKLCPYGGGRVGANCKLVALDGLLTKGIEYWVDTNIQYPGVYYRQSR